MIFQGKNIRGISISHPLGDVATSQIEPERLEKLVQQLRNGDLSPIKEIVFGHLKLAIKIASQYARLCPQKAEVLVSESIYGVVSAVMLAKEKLKDNCITPWITSNCHRYIMNFISKDHIIRIPRTTILKKRKLDIKIEPIKIEPISHQIPEVKIYDLKVIELREIFDKIAQSELDTKIIELRIEGYTDEEIGEKLERTKQNIQKHRSDIQKRYEEFQRKWQ